VSNQVQEVLASTLQGDNRQKEKGTLGKKLPSQQGKNNLALKKKEESGVYRTTEKHGGPIPDTYEKKKGGMVPKKGKN